MSDGLEILSAGKVSISGTPAGVLVETETDSERSVELVAKNVYAAAQALRRAGFTLVLLPVGAKVYVRNPRRRWWRRRERSTSE